MAAASFTHECTAPVDHGARPVAYVTAAWSPRGQYWALTVLKCPYCGRQHFHGGGGGPRPLLGARAPHCLSSAHPHYELVEVAS
jgi:hypothetical protein